MRDPNDACALRNRYRLNEVHPDLPVEIPFGSEDRLHFSIRINQTNFIILAAQVHVGLHVDQLRIDLRRHFRDDFSIGVPCRDRQIPSCWAFIDVVPVLGWVLGKDNRESGPVRRLFAGGRVVHVKNDIRAFRHELCRLEQTEVLRA